MPFGIREHNHSFPYSFCKKSFLLLKTTGKMKLIPLDTYQDVCRYAAKLVAKRINEFGASKDNLFNLGDYNEFL